MKKILFAVLAMLVFGTSSAQFKVEQKQKFPEVVWQDGFKWAALYQQELDNGELYYFIGLRSSNQFDDKMLLHLGKKDKAKVTLQQLANELHKEGEIYELSDDKGEPFTMHCIAMNYYRIYKKGYAGYGSLSIGQVRKMLSAITY